MEWHERMHTSIPFTNLLPFITTTYLLHGCYCENETMYCVALYSVG